MRLMLQHEVLEMNLALSFRDLKVLGLWMAYRLELLNSCLLQLLSSLLFFW